MIGRRKIEQLRGVSYRRIAPLDPLNIQVAGILAENSRYVLVLSFESLLPADPKTQNF
jgi:hypothetical protein